MDSKYEKLMKKILAFRNERDWAQYHDPKNLAMALASEAGELLAEFRWVTNDDADAFGQAERYREAIVDEVADIGITLLLFCDRTGIDLVEAMSSKIARNRERYPPDVVRGRWEKPDDLEQTGA